MTTYYVGVGGNDGNNGTSWALRKLTLNGAEDIPVAAGDNIYVGAGVYRELLTLDVSGGAGTPITYIGDVTGANTDGVGGVVRITGSDNDQTAVRNNCITIPARSYRTFRRFTMDTVAAANNLITTTGVGGTNIIIEDCTCSPSYQGNSIYITGASSAAWTIRRCYSFGVAATFVYLNAAADLSNTAHVVENCVSSGQGYLVYNNNVGGVTVRNCTAMWESHGVRIASSLAPGQTVDVYGCILFGCGIALRATALGELVENYNTFYGNGTDRNTVNVGANSVAYPPLFDLGLLHAGAGQVSGFRLPQPQFGALSSWSQVGAIADGGTNATLDLTGLARPVTDGKRSWGAVQYQNVAQETGTVRTGTRALGFADAGRAQFKVPTLGAAVTVSVYCYREANYAGVNPAMVIKQAGQADRTTTDAGAAGAWNQLTDTFVPSATPPWFVVELVSSNTDAANPATNDAFFDDLTVTVGATPGGMETWLWDRSVGDWVSAAGAAGGGLMRHPGMTGNVNG